MTVDTPSVARPERATTASRTGRTDRISRSGRTTRRLALGALALVAALVLSACWSANQNKLLTMTNDARKANGRAALAGNVQAMDKAQRWAQHMADTGVVEHTGGGSAIDPSGLPTWCAVGENVGRGTSLQNVFDTWMASRTHHANILGTYSHIGTGVVRKGGYVYAVQIFYRAC
jgi:uncharacterized protein YkwD